MDLDFSFCQGKHLFQRRYLLGFGPAARVVGGGVEAPQVGEIEIKDIALSIGTFLHGIVVEDDGMTVATHMNIKLYGIDREVECIAERGQGIFEGKMRAAQLGN